MNRGIVGLVLAGLLAAALPAARAAWYWIWPLLAFLALPQFCFAVCGAGRVLGLDGWLEPVLRRQATAGAGWARLLDAAV